MTSKITNSLIQSPYVYLQGIGSTATEADGSPEGIHLRWDFLKELGDTHLPKGTKTTNTFGFNKPNDFVTIQRVPYSVKYPTVINFASQKPTSIDAAERLWVYSDTNTKVVVYLYFLDHTVYDGITVNASTDPKGFIQAYGAHAIHVEVKDELFFSLDVIVDKSTTNPQVKVESIGVPELNSEEKIISCRHLFNTTGTNGASLLVDTTGSAEPVLLDQETGLLTQENLGGIELEGAGTGQNLLDNPSFETGGGFTSDYVTGTKSSKIQSTDGNLVLNRPSSIIPSGMYGIASSSSTTLFGAAAENIPDGSHFMVVAGATTTKLITDGVVDYKTVWKQTGLPVVANSNYFFSGSMVNLTTTNGTNRPILGIRIIGNETGMHEEIEFSSDLGLNEWKTFQFEWNSETNSSVTIEIVDKKLNATGNTFGLDNLFFGTKNFSTQRKATVVSENLQEFRFLVQNANLEEIRIETYRHFIEGINKANTWTNVVTSALSEDDTKVYQQLEDAPRVVVDNKWKKFNETAFVKVQNYKDKWHTVATAERSMKKAVSDYLTLSTDAVHQNLTGSTLATQENDGNGIFNIDLLDLLKLVGTDYHVARMLGMGYIDTPSIADDEPMIYLLKYTTKNIPATKLTGSIEHHFMTIPLTKLDNKPCLKVNLQPAPSYGLFSDNGNGVQTRLTDEQGYTPLGNSRFVNLLSKPMDDFMVDFTGQPFFEPSTLFCSNEYTVPSFIGLKYRLQGTNWNSPELSHSAEGWVDTTGVSEVSPIPLPEDLTKPVYLHQEFNSGVHEYAAYGINLFSRASALGDLTATDTTQFKIINTLQAPSGVHAQLIQDESPLIFTSQKEQEMLTQLSSSPDKTLVRLLFNYNHFHDLAYQPIVNVPNQPTEYHFGNKVELYFRTEAPRVVSGAIKSINNSDPLLSVIKTRSYKQFSDGLDENGEGTVIDPNTNATPYENFVGGVFVVAGNQYSIVSVVAGSTNEGPRFTVEKNKVTEKSTSGSGFNIVYNGPDLTLADNQLLPDGQDEIFMALENIGNVASWGSGIKLEKEISLGMTHANWETTGRTETWIDSEGNTISQRLRGFWDKATITEVTTATQPGVYEIDFAVLELPRHPEYIEDVNQGESVDWFNGVIRVETPGTPASGHVTEKRVLQVIKIENVGVSGSKLKVFAIDPQPNINAQGVLQHRIKMGSNVDVNYYPSYSVYLKAEPNLFNKTTISTGFVDSEKRTYIAARAVDTINNYTSNVSTPSTILAQEVIAPGIPDKPMGGTYATPPDFYNKSTYTFKAKFPNGEPFAAVFYRVSGSSILNALYSKATVASIEATLKAKAEQTGGDAFFVNRWVNLLSFNYDYNSPSTETDEVADPSQNGLFRMYGEGDDAYRFPNPDNPAVFTGQNPGDVIEKIKEEIFKVMLPLTEQPIMYKFIKRTFPERPVNKKQVLRKEDGTLLSPNNPDDAKLFDMAPMVVKTGGEHSEIQFTDYTLDGSAVDYYFYCAREIGSQMMMGDHGKILGPIRLVNTSPAEEPKIVKTLVQIENPLLEIAAGVNFEINSYGELQQIEKFRIYRTSDQVEAMSVRSMDLVKEISFTSEELAEDTLLLTDDFADELIPYGDPLFYRIVALRGVSYERDGEVVKEYAPSKPSKLILTSLVDPLNPIAPTVTVTNSTIGNKLTNVALSFNSTAYNGTYFLYKMNDTGNWVKIYEVQTKDEIVNIPLTKTDLATSELVKIDEDDATIYHRFKVDVINTSGLMNLEEKTVIV